MQIIMFIIFWDFLIVEQIFLSPQVKQSVAISNKLVYTKCRLVYTSRLKTYDLKKLGNIRKNCCVVLTTPPKMKILSVPAKISWKIEIELFLYFTWKLEFAPNILWMIVVSFYGNCYEKKVHELVTSPFSDC